MLSPATPRNAKLPGLFLPSKDLLECQRVLLWHLAWGPLPAIGLHVRVGELVEQDREESRVIQVDRDIKAHKSEHKSSPGFNTGLVLLDGPSWMGQEHRMGS